MSELHASVRKDISVRGRSSRRSRRNTKTEINQEELNAKRDAELRAKVRIKLAEQPLQEKPEAKAPEGPRILGRASSEELQKILNDKKRQAQARQSQRQQYERGVTEKARAKIAGKEDELLQEPPETRGDQSAKEELPDPADSTEEYVPEEVVPARPQGETATLPRQDAQRLTGRSVILRAGKGDPESPAGSQRAPIGSDPDAEAAPGPKRTRLVFKLAGVLLLLFAGVLGYRWIAMGKAPTDLVTVEGQQEFAGETKEAVSAFRNWALSDIKELAGGKAPETEEESARLVEESKVLAKGAEQQKSLVAKAGPARVSPGPSSSPAPRAAVDPRLTAQKSTRPPPPSYTQGRTGEGAGQTSSEAYPWLAPAREAFAQANVYYAQSDPRASAYDAIQKNIRLARPLFERCLDECDKARRKGNQGPEIDSLEQNAAMRLYDCNKRSTVK